MKTLVTLCIALLVSNHAPAADHGKANAGRQSPRYLFSKDCDPVYAYLNATDWYPLDMVLQKEGAAEAVRIIRFRGWGGAWSVTVFSGLPKSDWGDPYLSTGSSIHYQYNLGLADNAASIIHRSALQPEAARTFMNQAPFVHPENFKRNDFQDYPHGENEAPIEIVETLNKGGYHCLVRIYGGYRELGKVFDSGKELAESVFRKDLSVLEEMEKQRNKAPQKTVNALKK